MASRTWVPQGESLFSVVLTAQTSKHGGVAAECSVGDSVEQCTEIDLSNNEIKEVIRRSKTRDGKAHRTPHPCFVAAANSVVPVQWQSEQGPAAARQFIGGLCLFRVLNVWSRAADQPAREVHQHQEALAAQQQAHQLRGDSNLHTPARAHTMPHSTMRLCDTSLQLPVPAAVLSAAGPARAAHAVLRCPAVRSS